MLGDVTMGAFDLAGADRQSFGQGLAIVQRVGASAKIAMAGSHGRVLVVDLGRFAMSRKRPQDSVADLIEINSIAALVAELRLDLADDPWRAVADRVNPEFAPKPARTA